MKAVRSMRIGTIAKWLWVAALAIIILVPVYITVVSAFLPHRDVTTGNFLPDPRHFTFENFAQALDVIPFGQQYVTSVLVTVLQTSAQVLFAALAAYALVFPRWRGRTLAFVLIIATLAIPGESLVIPNYEFVTGMGLRDSILGIVIPYLAAGYAVFLLRTAFLGVHREMWEAARLDGCGDLRTLFSVILPTVRPQLTTATLWCAIAAWNGYFWPLLITDSPNKRTLQVGVSQLVSAEGASPAVIAAGTSLVLLPTLALVIIGQRFLLRGLAAGSLH
ncbi:ABC transporter permease subunit [Rhodococcus erythropolis]|uniref:carbohydrate ABC transporter permease n=1 Tax=Rhodococcus erythropolis TaxID=1833 RepID=UPI0012918CEF|nr:carbohydrate ABC transporter permease [Rhodococcus erythropolis]MQP33483.1 ABC transporter permease subunit [Rhodococcus erythropolis]